MPTQMLTQIMLTQMVTRTNTHTNVHANTHTQIHRPLAKPLDCTAGMAHLVVDWNAFAVDKSSHVESMFSLDCCFGPHRSVAFELPLPPLEGL